MNNDKLILKIINTLRSISIDMIENAKSGHPGMVLGCAPMMFILWCKIMKFNSSKPLWKLRDKFILSNGHGCALLYSMLYLLGYDYSLKDLKKFRQLHSKTPGHPEYNPNLGIEISTGPLGQGIANGVGMAIACKKLNINNNIFVMCGDGCLMEGISYEATSLAGHLQLNNLILLYDNNNITIDGITDITFTENIKNRFIALNWDVLEVKNGDQDFDDIYKKLLIAKQSKDKPTIIIIKTTIGYGSVFAGLNRSHGSLLGLEKTVLLKKYLFNNDYCSIPFYIDDDIRDFFSKFKIDNNIEINEIDFTLNNNLDNTIQKIREINLDKNYSTRESSGNILKKLVDKLDIIIGSADLGESTKTYFTFDYINKNDFRPKYLNYGVREHAMLAIANGISTYDIIPIVSTFLVFITYCLTPLRMAAMAKHKVIYIFTHDSVMLGEDGPSHQPIESLTILRSIPNLLTFRPCDTTEVSGSYQMALKYDGPSAIVLSRQEVPNILFSDMDKMKKGGYIIHEAEQIKLIIVATGSEVFLALEVIEYIKDIRIVSMPCCNLFDLQTEEYKEEILPKNIKKMSIEAGLTSGWYKYVDYTFGIDTFGTSANINDIKKFYGFNVEKLIELIDNIIKN